MTLESIVVLAAETEVQLPLPLLAYPAIAAVFFTVLGFVTWSYRAAANRSGRGAPGAPTHDAGH